MITVTKQSNSVLFEFENNPHYLQQGTMEVPFNSLILVEDESDMITFRKASTNDILFSAMYTEFSSLGNTKDAVVSALEDMMFAEGGGGGGVDPEDVVEIVESALTDYWTSAQTQSAINSAVSGKQDTLVSGTNIKTINNQSLLGSGNINISGGSGSYQYYTEDTENKTATIDVQTDDGLGNKSENRVFVDGGDIIIESYNETDDGEGNTGTTDTQVDINSLGVSIIASSDDGIDTTQTELDVQPMGVYINSEPIATESYVDAAVSGKVDTTAITSAITSASTDAQIPTAKAVYDAIPQGGSNIVELTQAQYDALVSSGTVDPDSLYIISDATEINVSGYAESSAVTAEIAAAVSGKADTSAVTQSLSSKQDALVSGTNIKTINNESLLGSGNITIGGGGGATYSAGTNISIDSANTINCTLNLRNGTGINSIAGGDNAIASGNWSFAFGSGQATGNYAFATNGGSKATQGWTAAFNVSEANNRYAFSCGTSKANGFTSFASGWDNKSLNDYESSFGYYNVSVTGSTASGQTLFSVGNGTSSARHNALEIRQNGDIYVNDGTNDVKLQDTITGTAANTTALGGLKLVSLTQSEYDALATKDSTTIYFIKNNSN